MVDLRNQLTLCATLHATLGEDPIKPKIPPSLVFNYDMTTIHLETTKEPLYVTKGAMEELAKHARNASDTSDDQQPRYVGCLPLLSAEGKLVCCVLILKHKSFPGPELKLVSLLAASKVSIMLISLARLTPRSACTSGGAPRQAKLAMRW